ncbi:YxlC family protein [Halobacillus sp. BAB-2008]|uniref:YxlC family protein n=1 Tax=Halobacillus sp. BAB-2008 TaxID=1246484 RepID=UPI0002A51A46|nr:YxlC family protein [Halobacillus sp. BAB-2008]ELK48856.1 hypothetical protein D479_01135 [Halobacillus sp. BAB-2008]
MNDNNKKRLIEQHLHETSKKIDDYLEVDEPSFHQFEAWIEEHSRRWYQRLWIELVCLWLVAAIGLSALSFTFIMFPSLFLIIQIIAVGSMCVYALREKRRSVVTS